MTLERWQQVARVYQSAMEQEPGTQGAYLTPDDRLMAVRIDIADQTVKAGTPKPLFKVRIGAVVGAARQ